MDASHDRRTVLRRIGAAGAAAATVAVAGCGGGGGNGDGDDATPTPTDSPTPTATATSGGGWQSTDVVDMTDELTFEPERIQVSAGTTVTWENVGAVGHTVTAYEDEIPDGATYFASGGFDSEEAARDGYPDEGNITEGATYEHTFETKGEYKYFCIPHEMNGMIGYVKVI